MGNLISVNIKKLRIAKNFTQEQLAEMLNVNTQTISRWECGVSMPDILLLPEISRIFGVTVDDLYKEKPLFMKILHIVLCQFMKQQNIPTILYGQSMNLKECSKMEIFL